MNLSNYVHIQLLQLRRLIQHLHVQNISQNLMPKRDTGVINYHLNHKHLLFLDLLLEDIVSGLYHLAYVLAKLFSNNIWTELLDVVMV